MNTKAHLGGHMNGTAMPIKTLNFICDKYNITSIIDIGCGPAGMVEYANHINIHALGIDGDTSIGNFNYIKFHDYNDGPIILDQYFDLAYSTEFLEHVHEIYMDNYMQSFQKAQYVFCSAAYPGQGGYHHVNEQYSEYWIQKFNKYNFTFLPDELKEIQNTSNDKLVNKTGLFFKNNLNIVSKAKTPFAIDVSRLKKALMHYYNSVGKNIAGYDLKDIEQITNEIVNKKKYE